MKKSEMLQKIQESKEELLKMDKTQLMMWGFEIGINLTPAAINKFSVALKRIGIDISKMGSTFENGGVSLRDISDKLDTENQSDIPVVEGIFAIEKGYSFSSFSEQTPLYSEIRRTMMSTQKGDSFKIPLSGEVTKAIIYNVVAKIKKKMNSEIRIQDGNEYVFRTRTVLDVLKNKVAVRVFREN